jgi:hypothetical protein
MKYSKRTSYTFHGPQVHMWLVRSIPSLALTCPCASLSTTRKAFIFYYFQSQFMFGLLETLSFVLLHLVS